MTSKKTILVVLLLSLSNLLQAQKVDLYWGKETPVKLGETTTLIGRRGETLFGLKSSISLFSSNKPSLVLYNMTDLQPNADKPLFTTGKDGKGANSNHSFEGITFFKDKNVLFVTSSDKSSKKLVLWGQEFDNKGNMKGNLTRLDDTEKKGFFKSGSFETYVSRDSSKFLIVDNPPYEKYAGEKFKYKIYDQSFKLLHELSIELPYKDKNVSVSDYILDNDGRIYALAQITKEAKEKKKEESTYYYEVIAINPEGKGSVSEYEIKLPESYITDAAFDLDDKGNVIAAGFYAKIRNGIFKVEDLNGIFYLRINRTTKEVMSKSTKEFDKEFIKDIAGSKKANKGRGISQNYDLKQFIRKSDGGAILIAEEYYMYTVTTYNKNGGSTTTYHYVRNNIIGINISPSGEIKWLANIPKYQHTVNDRGIFSSFFSMSLKDKIYLIYNDNKKNYNKELTQAIDKNYSMGRSTTSVAGLVALSENGSFEKKPMFDSKVAKSVIMPEYGLKIGNGEAIVPTVRSGIYCCFIPFRKGVSKLLRIKIQD